MRILDTVSKPTKRCWILAVLDALQAEVDALKHLQSETTVKHTGQAAACLRLSEYQLTRALPKKFQPSLPTVEQMETELARLIAPMAKMRGERE